MSEGITLHVGSIAILCGATLDEARVADIRDAIPRALSNWPDVIDLLSRMGVSPHVELALAKSTVHALVHSGEAAATAVSVPAKATGYDVLAKILRELDAQYKKQR